MVDTCTVTATSRDFEHAVRPGDVFVFTPRLRQASGGIDSVYVPLPITVTADEAGEISVGLVPAQYYLTVSGANDVRKAAVTVPDVETASLGACIDLAATPPTMSELQELVSTVQQIAAEFGDLAAAQEGIDGAVDLAQGYAQTPEDTTVPGGTGYSALHYAAKAGADAAAADAARELAEAAVTNAQAAALTVATWTALAALTAAVAGTGAEVLDSDTGSHTDPVVGGTVANAGRYTWSASPAGWKRIGATGLSSRPTFAEQSAADATVQALAEGLGGGATVQEAGRLVLVADDGGPLDTIDLLHGGRRIENLAWPGGEMLVQDGKMPLLRDAAGSPILEHSLLADRIEAPVPVLGRESAAAQFGMLPTMLTGAGDMVAGYATGEYRRLHPRVHGGLVIRGDHNRIPQLWYSETGERDTARVLRQVTFSQHGVLGYRWTRFPTPTEDGEVILDHGDTDLIRDRRFTTRRALIPRHARATAKTKVVFIVVIGQSNSAGAGTNGDTPSGVIGPQTIRTHLPVDGGVGVAPAWPYELLTFVGGTLPHQVGVDAAARTVAIDAAQIASIVPMREGIGGTASNQGGGRESLSASLALHLAGPNGYDGSAYILSAGFGFGATAWQALFLDDLGVRRTAYLNALEGIEAAQAFAAAKSLPLEVHWLIDHGETNANDDRAVYAARITDWQAVMASDVAAITGQAITPQVFLAQTGWTKDGAQEPCGSALGQLDAAMANADIHILPPGYWADHDGDTVHFKAPENQLRGALYGEVIADWLIRGQDAALHMTAATWSGSTISLQMTHPVEIDIETVINTGNSRGFSHTNSGGTAATVSRVEADTADPTILTVTCSSAIATGTTEVARIAHSNAVSPLPNMGYFGGLRSSFRRADWHRYSLIDGRPLPIFASIQSITATEV